MDETNQHSVRLIYYVSTFFWLKYHFLFCKIKNKLCMVSTEQTPNLYQELHVHYVYHIEVSSLFKQQCFTSILIVFLFVITGFVALKWAWRANSVFGSTIPLSCVTEKSSPKFSSPERRHPTGIRVRLRRNNVLVSFL